MNDALSTAWMAIKTCFKKYGVFTGRAGRQEYWWFALFAMAGFWIVAGACALCGALLNDPKLGWTLFYVSAGLWGAAVGLPHAAVGARRLRDTGHSGWFMLAHLVPSGHWAAVALSCAPGDPLPNRFGPPEPLPNANEPGLDLDGPRATLWPPRH